MKKAGHNEDNKLEINSQVAKSWHIAKFWRYWSSNHVSMKVPKLWKKKTETNHY